jgi:hypothetical protein
MTILSSRQIYRLATVLDQDRVGSEKDFVTLWRDIIEKVAFIDLFEFEGLLPNREIQEYKRRIIKCLHRLGDNQSGGIALLRSDAIEADELRYFTESLEIIEQSVNRLTVESGIDIRSTYAPLVLTVYLTFVDAPDIKQVRIQFINRVLELVTSERANGVNEVAVRLAKLVVPLGIKNHDYIRAELPRGLSETFTRTEGQSLTSIIEYLSNSLKWYYLGENGYLYFISHLYTAQRIEEISNYMRTNPVRVCPRSPPQREPFVGASNALQVRRHDLIQFIESRIDVVEYRRALIEGILALGDDEYEFSRIEMFIYPRKSDMRRDNTFGKFGNHIPEETLQSIYEVSARFGIRLLEGTQAPLRQIISCMVFNSAFENFYKRKALLSYIATIPGRGVNLEGTAAALRNFMMARRIREADFNEESLNPVPGMDWSHSGQYGVYEIHSDGGQALLRYWANFGEIRRTRGMVKHKFNREDMDVSDVTNHIMRFAGKAGEY